MTIFAVLATLLSLALSVDPDPTTICFPRQIQFEAYDLTNDEMSTLAIDFDRGYFGFKSDKRSFVQDMNNLKEYIKFNETCYYFDLPVEQVLFRCLPADSVFLGDFLIGFGSSALPGQAWEVYYGTERIIYAFTNQPGEPRYPIISQIHEGFVSSTFSINPSLTITHPGIHDIPSDCTPGPTAAPGQDGMR